MKIMVVDDHAIVRAGLRKLLAMGQDAEVFEATTGRESLSIARAHALDLIVLDLNLPELGGIELLSRLRQVTTAPILVLSMHAEQIYASRALAAGAQGYVSKNASPEDLLTAIRRVAAGGRYIEPEIAQSMILDGPTGALAQLTPRDLEILRHLGAGKSLGEIADALGLGYKTIANNCSLMKTKLGVTKTADLLRIAVEAGVS